MWTAERRDPVARPTKLEPRRYCHRRPGGVFLGTADALSNLSHEPRGQFFNRWKAQRQYLPGSGPFVSAGDDGERRREGLARPRNASQSAQLAVAEGPQRASF